MSTFNSSAEMRSTFTHQAWGYRLPTVLPGIVARCHCFITAGGIRNHAAFDQQHSVVSGWEAANCHTLVLLAGWILPVGLTGGSSASTLTHLCPSLWWESSGTPSATTIRYPALRHAFGLQQPLLMFLIPLCRNSQGTAEHNQNSHRQRIVNWINATGGKATAFDVTTKGILHAVFEVWAPHSRHLGGKAETKLRIPGGFGLWGAAVHIGRDGRNVRRPDSRCLVLTEVLAIRCSATSSGD